MAEKAKNKQQGDNNGGAAAVTLVFKVDLHCEGCAQKLKKSLRHLKGVESVKADHLTNKVTVVAKVDPTVVKLRVEEKTKKTIELVSPPPAKNDKDGGGGGAKKSDEKPQKKPDDIKMKAEEKKPKEAAEAKTVVLKTNVHCDGCVDKMKKIVNKCKGVQTVKVELSKDQITIKGTMDVKEMLPYLIAKFKRPVEVVSTPEKKADGAGEGKSKDGGKPASGGGEGGSNVENHLYKMEYNGYPFDGYGSTHFYNPQEQQVQEPAYGDVAEYGHALPYFHAPQIFSDENPNACSIM